MDVFGGSNQAVDIARRADGAGNRLGAAALHLVDVLLGYDANQLVGGVDHHHVMHAMPCHHQRRLINRAAPVEHQQAGIAHHRHDHAIEVEILGRDAIQEITQRKDTQRPAALGFQYHDRTDMLFRHRLHGLAQAGFRRGGDRLAGNDGGQLAMECRAHGIST